MDFYNILKILFSVCVSSLIEHVSARLAENIVGGYIAHERTFKYQVSVQGKRNISTKYFGVCGGVLIHNQFALSAAHCFIDRNCLLKVIYFSVVVGTTDLKTMKNGIRVDVDNIYLPDFDNNFSVFNLAVVKLKTSLEPYKYLVKMDLPSEPVQSLEYSFGTISGFGCDSVTTKVDENTVWDMPIELHAIPLLKFGTVSIVSNEICKAHHPAISNATHICGLMIPDFPGQQWGICRKIDVYIAPANVMILSLVEFVPNLRNELLKFEAEAKAFNNFSNSQEYSDSSERHKIVRLSIKEKHIYILHRPSTFLI